jgi:hypothetical protein
MKKDLVIGIVGTLILLTAMVGVFRYEAAQQGSSFDVTWASRSVDGAPQEDVAAEGTPLAASVNVTQANLTRVEFVLEWTDDDANTAPDRFNLTVTSPTGESRSASADSGSISLVFEGIASAPPPARLLGSDEAAARAQALRQYASAAGTGAWNVTITLEDAGDVAAPAGQVPVPQLQDVGNTWTLRPVFTFFEATLTPA